MREVATYYCKIYIAGDYQSIVTFCRKFCFDNPLCVTVTPTLFVYKGGAEEGVEIGLINYPKYPQSSEEVFDTAVNLANELRRHESQWAYSIVAPDKTVWSDLRE